jgi:hypothetical protein
MYNSDEYERLSCSATMEFQGREETVKAVLRLWRSFIDQLPE